MGPVPEALGIHLGDAPPLRVPCYLPSCRLLPVLDKRVVCECKN